jgi:hypothetical protein
MMRDGFSLANVWAARCLGLGVLFVCVTSSLAALAAPQADSDIPPDATPQIQQTNPSQATPGAHVTVVIQGSNFSAGAYVSSVSAAVHVESSKRVSATQIGAQLSISASAHPSTVSLLVSNPASRAAETAFKIVAGEARPAPATPVAPAPPAAPPTPEVNPSAPDTPVAPPAPSVPAAPVAPAPSAVTSGPEVTTIEPPSVGPGFDMDLKITGKNFVPGAKVSFANPGIRVMGVASPSTTELTVHIKVARDAAPGVTSLYVFNPDDREVENAFEVTGKGAVTPSIPTSPGSPSIPASADTQRYEAFHLGNPAEIFQVRGKVKGALVVSSGIIRYQEDGKTLINISLSDIKEIRASSVATATFHITVTSGKTYHFAPGSLRPSDARNLVDSLRKALPQ